MAMIIRPTKFPQVPNLTREVQTAMKLLALYVIGGLCIVPLVYGQCRADVSGRVLDEAGKPVANALVSFEKHDLTHVSDEAIHFFPTDSDGRFDANIDVASTTTYWVNAKKEEDGYPNNVLAFYDNRLPPEVTVKCHMSVSGVVVVIGPKAAYITHISVIDAKTGRAVSNASITLRRLAAPIKGLPLSRFTLSASATLWKIGPTYLGLAVPSNVAISYEISAPGFEASQPEVIRLPPLSKLEISIGLKR